VGHTPLLEELAVISAVGVIVALLLARLRLPTAAGLLFAGALVGPGALGLVDSIHSIEVLAEVGVVLLLFSIGLEFSLDRLRSIAGMVMSGGSLQVGLTGAAAFGVAVALGVPVNKAVFYGFVVALSSTAIVLRGLSERGEMNAPHGRFIVGTLIFQDLCVVPMVLVVPLLGPAAEGGAALGIATALGKAAAVVVATLVLARLVVPRLFATVDRSRSREIFLMTTLGLCIGTAWVTSLAGLSLALGAFLGGMVVAGTEYGHRAMGDILPLRDVFMSIFFVSLGMLFDPAVVLDAPTSVVLLVMGFLVVKAFIAALAALVMRFPARVAMLAGVGLAQFGEFGFVLTSVAVASDVVTYEETREVLAAGIISMFLTPVLVRMAPHVSAGARILRPLERMLGARGIDECAPEHDALTDHVVLVGYGVAGRLVARSLAQVDIPYLILELNADVVRTAREAGEPIYYGDLTSTEALGHASVDRARAVILLINDQIAAEQAVATVRRVAPEVPVLIRTTYLERGDFLRHHGATDVVFQEVESGVEMLARVLRRFDVPRNILDEQIEQARAGTMASDRSFRVPRKTIAEAGDLDDMKFDKILLRPGDHGVGKTPIELDLRRATGALMVALRRDGQVLSNPDPGATLEASDDVFLVGSQEQILAASRLLTRGADTA
jgi:monovalent cation:H+ antiporter-2, CPA2 family